MKRIYALPFLLPILPCAIGATAQAQDRDHVTLGAAVAAIPNYQGADDYRIQPLPVIDVRLGQFFASMADGVGLHVIDTPSFKVGGSITYVRGYRRRDVPNGIGRLSDAAGGRLFTSVNLGGVHATVGATRIFGGGTHGTVADARISYPVQANERITVIPTLSTTWANDKHMRRYFGITPAEATTSGLTSYRPSGGFKDASALVTTLYRLSDNLNLSGSAGITHLFDKAGDSPLVEQRWQPVGFLGIAYSF
ncbi:MAG: MipA/OmpV family protein [Sphingobium sp.]|nr:MipA/OmpV family protein [Sphingobium sp.]